LFRSPPPPRACGASRAGGGPLAPLGPPECRAKERRDILGSGDAGHLVPRWRYFCQTSQRPLNPWNVAAITAPDSRKVSATILRRDRVRLALRSETPSSAATAGPNQKLQC